MCHEKPIAGIPILYGVRVILTIATMALAVLVHGALGHAGAQSRQRGVSLWPLGLHWPRDLPFGAAFQMSVGDTRVLIASDTRLEALAWATGDPAWQSDLAAVVTPVVSDGRVFVADDTHVHALSELTGHVEWRLPAAGITVPMVYRSGWLLVTGADGGIRAVRATDGTVIWQTPGGTASTTDTSVLPPSIDGTRVFHLTTDGRLVALEIVDGTTAWAVDVPGSHLDVLAAHGLVYVSTSGRLIAYKQASGDRAWAYDLEMPIVSRLAADHQHVYAATLDNSVRAHRASNGHMRWNQKLDARVVEGLIADGGMVLVPHSDGLIRFLLATTGRPAGQLAPPSADARGARRIVTGGYGPTLRLARMTVSETVRTIETFARQTLPLTAAGSLSGTPVSLTPPGSRRP
jgi:YD repeat-containing protein